MSDHATSLLAGAFAGAVSTGVGLALEDHSIVLAGAGMGISAMTMCYLMNFRTPTLVLAAGYLATSLAIIFAASEADAATTTLPLEGASCKGAYLAQESAGNARLVLPAGCTLKR